jgi:hypothetical protein
MRRTVVDNLRIGLARARFLKSYLVSRLNTKHLDRLPQYVTSRLLATFVDDHPPDIDVRMEMLPFWRPFHGIRFDAPVVVVVTLDGAPAFGMALDIKGRNIRIIELHGVKGFCTRGRYHLLRLWPVLLVQACQHLAVVSGYRQVLMVRPHRYPSWQKRPELRQRLNTRLDGTALATGFAIGAKWSTWETKQHDTLVPTGNPNRPDLTGESVDSRSDGSPLWVDFVSRYSAIPIVGRIAN